MLKLGKAWTNHIHFLVLIHIWQISSYNGSVRQATRMKRDARTKLYF